MADRSVVEATVIDVDDDTTTRGIGWLVKTLTAAGVTGRRNSICNCPLAEYVKQKTGGLVEVDPIEVVLVDPGPGRVRIGNALAEFIRGFDDGKYPELETRPTARKATKDDS